MLYKSILFFVMLLIASPVTTYAGMLHVNINVKPWKTSSGDSDGRIAKILSDKSGGYTGVTLTSPSNETRSGGRSISRPVQYQFETWNDGSSNNKWGKLKYEVYDLKSGIAIASGSIICELYPNPYRWECRQGPEQTNSKIVVSGIAQQHGGEIVINILDRLA